MLYLRSKLGWSVHVTIGSIDRLFFAGGPVLNLIELL